MIQDQDQGHRRTAITFPTSASFRT